MLYPAKRFSADDINQGYSPAKNEEVRGLTSDAIESGGIAAELPQTSLEGESRQVALPCTAQGGLCLFKEQRGAVRTKANPTQAGNP
jgi:hypothetical protein